MAKKQENKGMAVSPAAIKALTILCALLFCALVFIFVQLRSNGAPPAVEIYTPKPEPERTPEPSPSQTPEETPKPGTKKSVMIERLYDSGLFVLGTKTENYYLVCVTEEDLACMLKLSVKDDYVQGFTLEIEGPLAPDVSKGSSAIETAIMTEYAKYLLYEEMSLRYILPRLLDAIEPGGAFAPNTSLIWTEFAINARLDGKTYVDSANGLSYTSLCTRLGVLTIAVGPE